MAKKEINVTINAESSKAEAEFKKVAKEVKDTGKAIDEVGEKANKSMGKLERAVEKVHNSIKTSMGKIKNSLKSASSGVNDLNNSFETMSKIATLGIIGSVASAIAGVGVSAVKSAAQMRQYEIAFQTMLKSTQDGTQMLQDLQKFAAATPAVSMVSGNAMRTANNNVNLSVSAVDASSFGAFLDNGGLDTIRQALFDNNRSFASEAGVW